jgi:hypothetical protein
MLREKATKQPNMLSNCTLQLQVRAGTHGLYLTFARRHIRVVSNAYTKLMRAGARAISNTSAHGGFFTCTVKFVYMHALTLIH